MDRAPEGQSSPSIVPTFKTTQEKISFLKNDSTKWQELNVLTNGSRNKQHSGNSCAWISKGFQEEERVEQHSFTIRGHSR